MRDYVYIDDHENALAEVANERDQWKKIAEELIMVVLCEQDLRASGFTGPNTCENCATVIKDYWKLVHDAA